MTFEIQITRESEPDGAIELCLDFKGTDWGCPARVRYDENDHPAEQPEVEVIAIWMEPAGNNVWRRASKDHEDWARDWADDHLDEMMVEARRP